MQKLIALLFFTLCSILTFGQNRLILDAVQDNMPVPFETDVNLIRSYPITLPANFIQEPGPFVALGGSWNPHISSIKVHLFYPENQQEVVSLTPDSHLSDIERSVSSLAYPERKPHKIYVSWERNSNIDSTEPNIKIYLYNPGHTPVSVATSPTNSRDWDICSCPLPDFQNRSQWCSGSSCPPDPTPQPTVVTHIIVHHSAGSNSSSDWAAVVEGIWDYHVNFNGWDDIGYNWLIDPNGVLYAGRADGLQGAHFCGKNPNTSGICVLGDFTNQAPTLAAQDKLVEFIAWKTCDVDVKPLEAGFHGPSNAVINRVSGHKDGCNTSCPGDLFYPLFPSIREEANEYIEENCATTTNVSNTTGLESPAAFPNLFSDHLFFKNIPARSAGWQVIAVGTGELVAEGISVPPQSLSTSHWAPGMYLCTIQTPEREYAFKVVKVR